MSMSDLFPSGPARPAPGLPLREVILSALAEAFITRKSAISFCADCAPPGGRLCADHRLDQDLARQYDDAYAQVAAGGAAWCDLAVKLISEMN